MKKHQVLLAEDDFDFGSILKQYLEIHSFDVVWAKDGEEVRRSVPKRKPKKAILVFVIIFLETPSEFYFKLYKPF